MDIDKKEKIERIIKQRKAAHRYYSEKSDVYRSFVDMEQKTFKSRVLSKKQKELIAVGISVVTNCESCMQWHIEQSARSGSTMQEVLEAIEVGIEMGGGPATVSARFALEVMETVFKD